MASAANSLGLRASSLVHKCMTSAAVAEDQARTMRASRSSSAATRPVGRLGTPGRRPAATAAPALALALARRMAAAATVVAMVLPLAATGCSDGESPASGGQPSGPALSAPPQSARSAAETQALAAWRGMWQAYVKAGLTADPAEPDLARYARDRALATLTAGLRSYRDKGQILKGEVVQNPQVSKAAPDADPTTVTITDCVDDTKFLVYKASGELLNDIPGGRRSALATVTKGDGDWKVSSFGVQDPDTC
jgi:hypothetical protein